MLDGWVYFADTDSGMGVKVGFSTNPYRRIHGFIRGQCSGLPAISNISLIGTVRGTIADEKRVHSWLSPWRVPGPSTCGKELYHAKPQVMAVVNRLLELDRIPRVRPVACDGAVTFTDEQIERLNNIAERCAQTYGPSWSRRGSKQWQHMPRRDSLTRIRAAMKSMGEHRAISPYSVVDEPNNPDISNVVCWMGPAGDWEEARFIAHAREDIEWLLELVETFAVNSAQQKRPQSKTTVRDLARG